MDTNADIDLIRAQAKSIVESGVLGRSRFYTALLEFLVSCAARGHTPKEFEIAAEVFSRNGDFDPSQDSMVRVYAHNLRQKLGQYYARHGADERQRLTIPKGEYRLTLSEYDPDAVRGDAQTLGWMRAAQVTILISVGFALAVLVERVQRAAENPLASAYVEVAESPLWRAVLDDDLPILVVVGDYYIFGEMDAQGNVDRLVREFEINSSRDLDELIMLDPELASRYVDLDLTYLPGSTAFALREFLRVLYTRDKPTRVISMSDLDADDLKDNHIVYVGYISALDQLIDFVLTPSELAIGRTFDELINTVTGESFVSEAGNPGGLRNYRDYGWFSTFPGPNGNQFVIIAGTRDEGLMHSAQAVSDPSYFQSSVDATDALGEVQSVPSFELLYEVAGFDRTNLDATIVHAAALETDSIWSGNVFF